MNFFWIDSYAEYDRTLTASVKEKLDLSYAPLAKMSGCDFHVVDINDLDIRFGEDRVLYNGHNLLKDKNKFYVNVCNPCSRKEKLLESLYRLLFVSENAILINNTSYAMMIDKDKTFAINIAKLLGFQTIPTTIISKPIDTIVTAQEICSRHGDRLVIKPKELLAGLGVSFFNSKQELLAFLENTKYHSRDFVVQPLIEVKADHRVLVCNYDAVACLSRFPQKGSYLANISQGGTSQTSIPSGTLKLKSEQIAKKIGASFLCVDWLEDDTNIYFSEIETAGGFTDLSHDLKLEVAKCFFSKEN